MPRFAANLSFLFTEYPFLQRFELAAGQGFRGVEFLFPYEWPPTVLSKVLSDAGLELVLFNLSPGNWAAGERGIASHPARRGEFRNSLLLALEYAQALGCTRIHALAGLKLCSVSAAHQAEIFRENLSWAATQCGAAGVMLLIEPINSRVDMPGYYLDQASDAFALQTEIAHPALKVQLDVYHAVMMGCDPAVLLREHLGQIAHIQIADVPGRQQPGSGTIDFSTIFATLDALNYSGWVGCEYKPSSKTVESMEWFLPFMSIRG